MTANRPAFRAVADKIREAIETGAYAPGSKLPSDTELAKEYDTSRATVGNAFRALLAEGYLIRKGRSYLVSPLLRKILRDANVRYRKTNREQGPDGSPSRGAFASEVKALGMRAGSDVTVDRAVPPAHVAELLGVSADETSVLSRARRMTADDIPVQLATSYIPGDIAFDSPLENVDTGPGGMISRLAEMGYAQAEVTEQIDVRTPTPAEVDELQLTEDARVYELLHVARTAEGRAVEVAIHVMPTHQWTLRYGWSLDSQA
uniref:Regulatory protein KorSA n=1 Tax=Streptomyces sp. F2 TaxID=317660 RepID=V9QFL9_9ACTN|nr:GntR family transcriptional regulator [Streptomyces sp. F2]AHC28134.1 regulatory protein KorSA [Streptomyces sp. F2]